MSRITVALAAAIAVWLSAAPETRAQLGLYQLPKDDFQWNWGDGGLDRRRGAPDISIHGGEGGFNCELTARTRASSTLTQAEIRDLENQLRTALDFIYATSNAMNYLEQTRTLDWATLDCKRFQATPLNADEKAEREAEAREKMLRELERRRARQQRTNDN